jgi:hypothetical protein
MLIEKFQSTEDRQESSLIERILPWTQNHSDVIFTDTSTRKLLPANKKNESIPSPVAQNYTQKASELISAKPSVSKTYAAQTIVDKPQAAQNTVNPETSLFEMWNVVESVGIKKEFLDKIFTTDEAISELYCIIEKRIHHQREQDMIKRLQEYVKKIRK